MQSARPFSYSAAGPLSCGTVSLETLAHRFGTPLYVYSADQIAERLALFQQAFANRSHLVCYAVKANSSLAILKLLAAHGAGFDIVSAGELERVRAAAPEALGRVVFSGVGKREDELEAAVLLATAEQRVAHDQERRRHDQQRQRGDRDRPRRGAKQAEAGQPVGRQPVSRGGQAGGGEAERQREQHLQRLRGDHDASTQHKACHCRSRPADASKSLTKG